MLSLAWNFTTSNAEIRQWQRHIETISTFQITKQTNRRHQYISTMQAHMLDYIDLAAANS